jgi:hypothetical protein
MRRAGSDASTITLLSTLSQLNQNDHVLLVMNREHDALQAAVLSAAA